MKNVIALVGAAAVILLANTAGWADSDTDSSRTPIFTAATAGQVSFGEHFNSDNDPTFNWQAFGDEYEIDTLPSDVVAMERGNTRNINHFTGRPASGKN